MFWSSNNDDLDTSSSVFEGSDCSSLKIPWSPGYGDDAPAYDMLSDAQQQQAAHVQKLSVGSSGGPADESTGHLPATHFRKRGDILHENGGTGGSTTTRLPETPKYFGQNWKKKFILINKTLRRERRKEERHRSTEEMSSKTETSKSTPVAPRGLLSRERSEPTISLGSGSKAAAAAAAAAAAGAHQKAAQQRSSSDHALSNGLEGAESRRLSSPQVGGSGVITASLKISVGATAAGSTASPTLASSRSRFLPSAADGNRSFTVDNEHEIPFIEDVPSPSSKQPPAALDRLPGTIKSSGPAQQHTILKSAPWTDSLAARDSSSANKAPESGVVRSKTTSSIGKTLARSHLVIPASKEEWLKKDKNVKSATTGCDSGAASAAAEEASVKKKAKKKYVGGSRNQSDGNLCEGERPHKVASSSGNVMHKRWNLIASSSSAGQPMINPDSM